MRRTLALLASAAVLVATGSLPAGAQQARQTPAGKYAQQAFAATNANRTHNGLKALKANDCVKHAAVRQAKLMAQREQMFHQDLGRVMRDCKLNTAGENVAYGFPSGRSVVNDGWMNSEGHRANILNPSFRLMGIGARKGHDGRWYVAQVFGRKA
ncbi:MAG TPA: CAP domain-containing protein [Nocardioides sp.]|uniref:CAP domain-containing protein n=1 Tax=Nocardioides sp. TaxID=35761 RepID=UPI002E35CC58|nr:CAP domain-containing protein [Nocardioides sp.]HEX5088863.1 CAP domain-containing protein [Nocardioides sp.]